MQGPTISPVYTYDKASGKAVHNFWAITIIVPKPRLYDAVQQLRGVRISSHVELICIGTLTTCVRMQHIARRYLIAKWASVCGPL